MKKNKKISKNKKQPRERIGGSRQVINVHIHSGTAADKRYSSLTGDPGVRIIKG